MASEGGPGLLCLRFIIAFRLVNQWLSTYYGSICPIEFVNLLRLVLG
jgi:hypothetical protein